MEKEILFTTSKWEILKSISIRPQSPLGIAKILNTSVANVSQQLRLLEAAGLVIKKRVANTGVGQPRALFSLKQNIAFISLASQGLAKKELLNISKLQVVISRIWLLNIAESDILSKFFYCNESIFNQVHNLYFVSVKGKNVSFETTNSTLASNEFSINFDGNKYLFKINQVEKISKNAELIYNEY